MTFAPCKRATLLIPSGPANDPDRHHLFVLLTDPNAEGKVLLATFSSVKPGLFYDPTCLVQAGEHPFVTRPTWVNYAHCRIEEAAKLVNGINAGFFFAREIADQALLARICKGLFDSPHAKPLFRRFYLACQE